jgi:hypothetical protein
MQRTHPAKARRLHLGPRPSCSVQPAHRSSGQADRSHRRLLHSTCPQPLIRSVQPNGCCTGDAAPVCIGQAACGCSTGASTTMQSSGIPRLRTAQTSAISAVAGLTPCSTCHSVSCSWARRRKGHRGLCKWQQSRAAPLRRPLASRSLSRALAVLLQHGHSGRLPSAVLHRCTWYHAAQKEWYLAVQRPTSGAEADAGPGGRKATEALLIPQPCRLRRCVALAPARRPAPRVGAQLYAQACRASGDRWRLADAAATVSAGSFVQRVRWRRP